MLLVSGPSAHIHALQSGATFACVAFLLAALYLIYQRRGGVERPFSSACRALFSFRLFF